MSAATEHYNKFSIRPDTSTISSGYHNDVITDSARPTEQMWLTMEFKQFTDLHHNTVWAVISCQWMEWPHLIWGMKTSHQHRATWGIILSNNQLEQRHIVTLIAKLPPSANNAAVSELNVRHSPLLTTVWILVWILCGVPSHASRRCPFFNSSLHKIHNYISRSVCSYHCKTKNWITTLHTMISNRPEPVQT